MKPMLYVANIDEAQITAPGPMVQAVVAHAKAENSRAIAFSGKIGVGIRRPDGGRGHGLPRGYGITSGGLDRLIVESTTCSA